MTAREMQIEFERQVQIISPDLIIANKLTSDDIFTILYNAASRFLRNNFLQSDLLINDSTALKKHNDNLRTFIKHIRLPLQRETENTDLTTEFVILPDDYLAYVRSNSIVSQNFLLNKEELDPLKWTITPNNIIKEEDVDAIITTYYNRPILPNPYVVANVGFTEPLNDNELDQRLSIIHDSYTVIQEIDLVYVRKLRKFLPIADPNNPEIVLECELPESTHQEIVEMAVEMFITEWKYRLNTQQSE